METTTTTMTMTKAEQVIEIITFIDDNAINAANLCRLVGVSYGFYKKQKSTGDFNDETIAKLQAGIKKYLEELYESAAKLSFVAED